MAAPAAWRPRLVEVCAWCAVSWGLALALLLRTGTPAFGNDGYQYLSVAGNIQHGNGAQTSIIYFDAERAHGTIPAPMVTFPPLYPALTALLSRTGIPLDISALAISQLSVAMLPLALLLAMPGGFRPLAFRATMLLLVFDSALLVAADQIGSDALFAALVAGAIACFSQALRAPALRTAMLWQISGWLLAGASYLVRYAGLVVLAALFLFWCTRWALYRDRRTFLQLLGSAVGFGIVLAFMLRNLLLTGSWKGGVMKQGPPRLQVRRLAVAAYHTFFGDLKIHAGVEGLVFLAGVAILVVLATRRRPSWRFSVRVAPSGFALMLCLVIGVYCAGLLYADSTMVISMSPRYLIPVLPPFLLLAGEFLSSIEKSGSGGRTYFTALALLLAGFLGFQARSLLGYTPSVPHQEIAAALRQRTGSGTDLATWIRDRVAPGEAITATDGQATAYALQLPTLCLADPGFTREQWNERTISAEMRRFHSRYLVLFPVLSAGVAPVQQDSPFLRGIIESGKVNPSSGFRAVAGNGAALVLQAP